jgi:eukaryotic-like serine/threonine-protein kinase
MSPDQARGELVDAHTDLFSFGAVLYEMATGRPAFNGATTAVIFHQILAQAPEPPLKLNTALPAELERIISKALEKDRDRRYQHAADIRSDLKRLKRDTDSGRSAGVSPAVAGASRPRQEAEHGQDARATAPYRTVQGTAGGPPVPQARDQRWALALAGLLALIAASGLVWFLTHRAPPQPAELTQKRLTFNTSENPVLNSAISPDGKYLAYSDAAGIHVKLLSTGDERPIPAPAGVPAGAQWFLDSWFPDGTQLLVDTAGPPAQHSMWTVSVLGQSARELREAAGGWEVSPDGKRLAYTSRPVNAGGWFQAAIETCDLTGANRTVVVRYERKWGDDYCWLPDGRMVYSGEESAGSFDGNLWQIGVDGHTGAPTGQPKRITQWAGALLGSLYAGADGKQLTLLKQANEGQVYLSELTAGGRTMSAPRRLTNDENVNVPMAWTTDSKAVLFNSSRNGTWAIFKQGISQETAEVVVTGGQAAVLPRLSADGAWVLYLEPPKILWYVADFVSVASRLMRIPSSGGVPQLVLETKAGPTFDCARAPASLCVIVESHDEKHVTVTAFDPVRGRGKVLRTIDKDPSAIYVASLSPDGSTLALSRGMGPETEIRIRLLSFSSGLDREITLKGWSTLAWNGLYWSPDGKGFYCGSVPSQGETLLYVDLQGNARVLWQRKGVRNTIWGVPSPDGRYLAMANWSLNSNVWMLEGF